MVNYRYHCKFKFYSTTTPKKLKNNIFFEKQKNAAECALLGLKFDLIFLLTFQLTGIRTHAPVKLEMQQCAPVHITACIIFDPQTF
jgi:hypothetical protein